MPEEGGGGSRAQMDQEALLGAWTLEGSGLIKAVLGTEFPREGGLGCTSGIWKVRVKRLRESRLDLLSPRLVGQQWVEKRSLSLSLLNCLPVSLTTRDGTHAAAVEEQGLSHWATRKSSIKGGTRRRGWRRDRVTPVWA